MTEFSDSYTRWHPSLCRASEQLRLILKEIEATIDDRTLVRAEVRNVRIKELPSLERKAAKNGWKSEEAFKECSDLVGGRVVCNNIEDVYRFAQFLKEHLPTDSGEFKVQDYIKQPNQRGYRALHVNFRLNGSDSFAPEFVPCEVQIRTRLQDAWGELTHGDIYKQLELPEDLRARSRDLAEVLAAADKIASDIRRRAVQEATAPEQRPDLRTVASGGLAFVFREIFGRSPPDYVVRQALNVCEELQISSLERFQEVLARSEFLDDLSQAYQSIMGVRAGVENLFLAALHALARGDRQALNHIRRKARRELREIDRIAKREMLSSLPRSVDELIAQLEDPRGEADVEGWAGALEATDSCRICGTTIVRPDAFAEAAVRHYRPTNCEEVRERTERALYQSSVERGGWGDSSLCSYHDDRADKD